MNEFNKLTIPLVITLFIVIAFISLFNLYPQITNFVSSLGSKNQQPTVQGLTPITLDSEEQEPLSESNYIEVGSCKVVVEVADTAIKRHQGLSGRKKLDPDSGMLFILPQPKIQPFWMLNMQFPLDFVWIRDNKIVGVHENVSTPEEAGRTITVEPAEPVNYVLELNAGKVHQCGIEAGQLTKISIE